MHDKSFRAYAAQSPTMQTVFSNRRLLKVNVAFTLFALIIGV